MRLPSGGRARCRDVTHDGKAPPSPEMTISGLTRGQVFGEDHVAKPIVPRLCRTCGPPLRRAVSFLGFRFSRESQATCDGFTFGIVAVAPSSTLANQLP